MKKKGEISLQIIIIAVLLLIVLIVLTVIFLQRSGAFTKGVTSCADKGGACLPDKNSECSTLTSTKCKDGICVKIPGTDCDKTKDLQGNYKEVCCVPLAG